MKKEIYIISYCLYGNKQRYFDALYDNAVFIREKYSNLFSVLVVIGPGVPDIWIKSLKSQEVIIIQGDLEVFKNIPNPLLRLYPILSLIGAGCFMRDSDSHLSVNEMNSMSKFIDSNYDYHIIRDHPGHLKPIMAGLFAVKRNGYRVIKNILTRNSSRIANFDRNQYDSDEIILADYVYPVIYKKTLIESNFNFFWNERSLISNRVSKTKNHFMGQIDSKYNLNYNKELETYKAGVRKMYLPFWMFKLSRYRYLYRLYWIVKN